MKKLTKIIIVTPWFGAFAGGAEVLAKNLAIEFNCRGIETLVFTTCCKSPYSSWWKNDYDEGEYNDYGVRTFRFSVNDTKKEYEVALGSFIHQRNKMIEEHYKNFFIAGINSDRLVEALGLYIDNGYEIIAMPYYQGLTHSVVNAYPRKVSITPCFHDEEPFYWQPIENLLNNAKHIFYNAHEEKELAIKYYGQIIGKKLVEASITGVGVETVVAKQEVTITDIAEKYFIYMGRKEEGKNVNILVKWFEMYKKTIDSNDKLIFIGGGDASLIPKSKNFVDYSYVSEGDKKNLLKNAIALINLSTNESFSIVIMEAWLNKIPIIVHGECPVTTGHAIRANGGLFPGNEDEFIACLKYLSDHRNNADLMGRNGLRYVEENYTYDRVLERYLAVLEQS